MYFMHLSECIFAYLWYRQALLILFRFQMMREVLYIGRHSSGIPNILHSNYYGLLK